MHILSHNTKRTAHKQGKTPGDEAEECAILVVTKMDIPKSETGAQALKCACNWLHSWFALRLAFISSKGSAIGRNGFQSPSEFLILE